MGPEAFMETLRIAPLVFEKDEDSNGELKFMEYAENAENVENVENDFTNPALPFVVPIEICY